MHDRSILCQPVPHAHGASCCHSGVTLHTNFGSGSASERLFHLLMLTERRPVVPSTVVPAHALLATAMCEAAGTMQPYTRTARGWPPLDRIAISYFFNPISHTPHFNWLINLKIYNVRFIVLCRRVSLTIFSFIF